MDMDVFSFPDYVMKGYQPQETYIGGRPCRTRQPADALLNCYADPPNVLSPIILVHFSRRSCGQGKASRLVRLTLKYP